MTFTHTAHLKVKTNFLEQFKVRVALHASLCTDLEIGCLKFDVHQEKMIHVSFFCSRFTQKIMHLNCIDSLTITCNLEVT